PLARQFLTEFSSRHRPGLELSDEALQALVRHDWPGNIRELRNRLQRAGVFAQGESLEAVDIFPETRLEGAESNTLADARKRAEADLIERALIASHGRIGDAAKQLGISRTTLWKRRGKTRT